MPAACLASVSPTSLYTSAHSSSLRSSLPPASSSSTSATTSARWPTPIHPDPPQRWASTTLPHPAMPIFPSTCRSASTNTIVMAHRRSTFQTRSAPHASGPHRPPTPPTTLLLHIPTLPCSHPKLPILISRSISRTTPSPPPRPPWQPRFPNRPSAPPS